ncbi:OLC1v1017038C1 [Oldenlandia corymbosa var. corymbosa]|uniref:OLC1v1017038C1 n=1 Tax=Oldenlandia corymbosa var. corymbosa TaxID=529605 RepID=A0AAV1E8I3_OLDCO|nr:OLC1v1017038C1 [Oldenlandia corymbosa var. corymbosa]
MLNLSNKLDFVVEGLFVPCLIASTVLLDCRLDLPCVATRLLNAEYDPKARIYVSPCCAYGEERSTEALFYASGMMVCIGGKSEAEAQLAARKYTRLIQKIGFPVKFKDFTIVRSATSGYVSLLEVFVAWISLKKEISVNTFILLTKDLVGYPMFYSAIGQLLFQRLNLIEIKMVKLNTLLNRVKEEISEDTCIKLTKELVGDWVYNDAFAQVCSQMRSDVPLPEKPRVAEQLVEGFGSSINVRWV